MKDKSNIYALHKFPAPKKKIRFSFERATNAVKLAVIATLSKFHSIINKWTQFSGEDVSLRSLSSLVEGNIISNFYIDQRGIQTMSFYQTVTVGCCRQNASDQ